MQCNIDSKGRAVRLLIGLATLLAGVIVLGAALGEAGLDPVE